jgi:Tol biopolymer transport system component
VSPDGTEVVYLSDSGGHGNLWVVKTDGSNPRQITFERESGVAIGVPKWSPRGDLIAFVLTRNARTALSLIRPDGSGLREGVSRGWAPCWSADGRWLYYWRLGDDNQRLEKMPIDGGGIVAVREAPAVINPAMSPDGRTLYFVTQVRGNVFGSWASDHEICRASPEDHPAEVLARVPRERIPGSPPVGHVAVSPDGQWLATSLIDGATTNLWALPAAGGAMRQFTDFGNRQIMIARSICWSPDSQSIYAAVAESETDIVLFDGLI